MLDKLFGTKWRNQTKKGITRRLWYLLSHTFWTVIVKVLFLKYPKFHFSCADQIRNKTLSSFKILSLRFLCLLSYFESYILFKDFKKTSELPNLTFQTFSWIRYKFNGKNYVGRVCLRGTGGVQDILPKKCYERHRTHNIETNQLICSANHWSGFFILRAGFSNIYQGPTKWR